MPIPIFNPWLAYPARVTVVVLCVARVGARTDSTVRLQLQREAWPISAHAHWHSTQDAVFGLCTLVLLV